MIVNQLEVPVEKVTWHNIWQVKYHGITLLLFVLIFPFHRSLYLIFQFLVLNKKHVVSLDIKIWVFVIIFRIMQSSYFRSLLRDKLYMVGRAILKNSMIDSRTLKVFSCGKVVSRLVVVYWKYVRRVEDERS